MYKYHAKYLFWTKQRIIIIFEFRMCIIIILNNNYIKSQIYFWTRFENGQVFKPRPKNRPIYFWTRFVNGQVSAIFELG